MLSPPKLKLLVVVGVVWLANALLVPLPAPKLNPVVWIGVAAGVVDGGAPKVKGVVLGAVAGVVVPKLNGAAEGVTAGVVDLGFPNENGSCAGVAAGVVDGVAPKENPLSLVGVLISNGAPRPSGLIGLGDSDPNENGLDCGVVFGFAAGVLLGNENRGFTGDGVAGVVDTGAVVDGAGVAVTLGCPNENGLEAGFAAGVAAGATGGARLPNEKGLGASFGASGAEIDTVGNGAEPNENGLAAAGASFLAGSAEAGGNAGVLGNEGKENPEVEAGAAGFVVPGAGKKVNPLEVGFGVSTAADVEAALGAVPKENGDGAGALASATGKGGNENGDGAALVSDVAGLGANENGDGATGLLSVIDGAGARGANEKGDGLFSATGLASLRSEVDAAGAGIGMKPKDIDGAVEVAATPALANGFEGNVGACGSETIGVMLKPLRTLDSVGVVDIMSPASESDRLYDSLIGLMFMGTGSESLSGVFSREFTFIFISSAMVKVGTVR